MNNNTKRAHRIIYIVLGCIAIMSAVIGAIWGVAVYAQNLETGIKENCDSIAEHDTIINDIQSSIAYLVEQARIKEIVDSLSQPEFMEQAQDIMKNNTGTDTFSTDGLGGK